MGALVRDDLVVEADTKVHFVEKECSYAFGSDVFLHGTENYPLSKPMVNHDYKGIEASRRGTFGDKVTRDLLEGVGCSGVNGGEWGNGRMGIGSILFAGCAAFDIFTDIGYEARPSEFSRDELAGFQVSRMAGSVVVMASLENGLAERIVSRNIDPALIGQDTHLNLPV